MVFAPANISNALRMSGLPIAREQIMKRQSGVRVFSAGGGIFFEYKIYSDAPSPDRTEEAIKRLSAMGYDVERVNGTDLYLIRETE